MNDDAAPKMEPEGEGMRGRIRRMLMEHKRTHGPSGQQAHLLTTGVGTSPFTTYAVEGVREPAVGNPSIYV